MSQKRAVLPYVAPAISSDLSPLSSSDHQEKRSPCLTALLGPGEDKTRYIWECNKGKWRSVQRCQTHERCKNSALTMLSHPREDFLLSWIVLGLMCDQASMKGITLIDWIGQTQNAR